MSPASKESWEMHPCVVSTAALRPCFFPAPRGALLITTPAQMGFLRMHISRVRIVQGELVWKPGRDGVGRMLGWCQSVQWDPGGDSVSVLGHW